MIIQIRGSSGHGDGSYSHDSSEIGDSACPGQGHTGRHQGPSEAAKARGRCRQESVSWFSWKISSESGQAGLGFAGVNNLRVSGHKDWPS